MNKSFEQFVKEYQSSALTHKAYNESLELFDRFLKGEEPTERAVEEYMLLLENKGLASASVNRHLSAIRAYFLWRKKRSPPEKRGYWDLMVKGPKVHNKLQRLISVEDILLIVSKAKNSYERALTMTLYDGALRISELSGLMVSDVDFRKKQIKITGKGEDEYLIPLGDETMQALKDYIGTRQGKVFPQLYYQFNYDIKRLGKQAGIKNLHPHELRHARAQGFKANGVSADDAQVFLRHKNIQTTLRYYRGDPNDIRKKINKAF